MKLKIYMSILWRELVLWKKGNKDNIVIIDNIEEAQEAYGEDVEVREYGVVKSEYIYITNGDWQDTYRVELVGLNDGQGGDIDFYLIKIVAK